MFETNNIKITHIKFRATFNIKDFFSLQILYIPLLNYFWMNLLEKIKKSKLNFVLETKFQLLVSVFVMGKMALWYTLKGHSGDCF